jgi:Domain of unknown function (DUF3883)
LIDACGIASKIDSVTNPAHSSDDPREQLQAVRDIFVNEAISAPRLFADLAKMEQYIAESYKTRSFIELIQNADDAGAKRFGIHQIGADVVVGNDGHAFTPQDVEALCRSGSSQKVRGQNTIGYRGIGFKSVVNISKRILVLSGEYAFGFDRAEIKRRFPKLEDVPLIRIPFALSLEEAIAAKARVAAIQAECAYKTIFIFESGEDRLIQDELSAINRHMFLFLRSVQTIEVSLGDHHQTIEIDRSKLNEHEVTSVRDGEAKDTWLLHRHPSALCDVVAFKFQDGEIISAEPGISVVHSFLPTTETSGALLKINGDYSTDPSRKAVDLDEASLVSFSHAAALIAEAVQSSIEGKGIPGIFRPLTSECPPGRFKRLMQTSLTKHFEQRDLLINGRRQLIKSLRLRPDWLNYEDYESLCLGRACQISKDLISRLPELAAFLERFDVPRLSLFEALDQMNSSALSGLGAAQVVAKCANQYRFDLTAERIELLKSICLFPIQQCLMRASELKSLDAVDPEFKAYLFESVAADDLGPFLNKLGIAFSAPVSMPTLAQNVESSPDGFQSQPVHASMPLANLTRWRSAEKNAEEYFRSLPGVLTVSDVSVANMGYDLDVVYSDGNRLFVEVKSVKSFAEPIKITNNEYASAHNHGPAYCIAIVINADVFQMKVVRDPIRTLVFQKQIERWSWLCEGYASKLEFPHTFRLAGEAE